MSTGARPRYIFACAHTVYTWVWAADSFDQDRPPFGTGPDLDYPPGCDPGGADSDD